MEENTITETEDIEEQIKQHSAAAKLFFEKLRIGVVSYGAGYLSALALAAWFAHISKKVR